MVLVEFFQQHISWTTAASTVASTSSFPTATVGSNSTSTSASSSTTTTSTAPDVYLNVPNLSVGRIELDVDQLSADINLAASVASLVTINAGISLSVEKINLTIADVEAELELIVRLGHLVDIVNRTFESLDLNPLLIDTLNDVTSLVTEVVAEVDGLLGTITQGDTTLSFVVDNLGNIVQQVTDSAGTLVSTIVGDYLTNMTYTGVSESLGSGLTEKTYTYSALNAVVDIIFNTASQVVQATVVKSTSTATATSASRTATSSTTSSASTVTTTSS
ncbi:hypothetical protein UCRPC4_g01917 [Phaeomoniella chlamydospora]|uniref:Uncharacterized protein n=1 Tax=Phaeomoniella chlamydospora TaxID=158046 RepID=A0A0G2GPI8_PHACM|nr:hypothetical protein UCRPC4_g01917 [Phaeomoniella chlamydospora]